MKRRACLETAVVAGIFVLLTFVAGFGVGVGCAGNKAIEAGAARWTINPKTGETTFEYCCKCDPISPESKP